jgi:hypothetical protein
MLRPTRGWLPGRTSAGRVFGQISRYGRNGGYGPDVLRSMVSRRTADPPLDVDPIPTNYEDLVIAGCEVRTRHDKDVWLLGDYACSVAKSYGDHKLQDYADAIGIAYETLRRYRTVAKAIESGRRRPDLSFSHHAEVAVLEPDGAGAPASERRADGGWRAAGLVAQQRG